jgi:hypothetical protein
MLRTQIYLPKNDHSELSVLAKKLGVPLSEIIRRMLKTGLSQKDHYINKGNNLSSLANLGITGGPSDLSKNFDKYLYS